MFKMGCESSRSINVEDQGNANYKIAPEKNSYFTELQIDCVRSTWPLVAKNQIQHGCSVFAEIFVQEPKLKEVFSFGNLDTRTIYNHPMSRRHAQKFMETIEYVCENMETMDDPENEVVRQLVLLGAKHASIPEVELNYFHVFNKCTHITWEQVLGEEYTVDMREAWNSVFEFIQEKIQDGFNLYMEDKEKENAQNGQLDITVIDNANNSSNAKDEVTDCKKHSEANQT